jgi:hypothetical protein
MNMYTLIDIYDDKAEQRLSETTETIDVYQGMHVHDKAEQGLSETIDVYQGIHVHDNTELGVLEFQKRVFAQLCYEHVHPDNIYGFRESLLSFIINMHTLINIYGFREILS